MPDQWYLRLGEESVGPFSLETVGTLLRHSRLLPSDLFRTSKGQKWEPASALKALASFLPPAAPTPPAAHLSTTAFDHAIAEAIELPAGASPETGEPRRSWILRMVRVRINAVAQVEGHGSFPVHDLSEGGVFLVTAAPIAVTTPVRLTLVSPELARPLQLAGSVVRVGQSEGGRSGFAIHFSGIAASERDLIHDLVKSKHVKPRSL